MGDNKTKKNKQTLVEKRNMWKGKPSRSKRTLESYSAKETSFFKILKDLKRGEG